jgi:hypothetical protein
LELAPWVERTQRASTLGVKGNNYQSENNWLAKFSRTIDKLAKLPFEIAKELFRDTIGIVNLRENVDLLGQIFNHLNGQRISRMNTAVNDLLDDYRQAICMRVEYLSKHANQRNIAEVMMKQDAVGVLAGFVIPTIERDYLICVRNGWLPSTICIDVDFPLRLRLSA